MKTIAALLLVATVLAAPAAAAPGRAMFDLTLGSTNGTPDGNVCAAGITCTYVPSVGALAPALIVPFNGTVTGFSVRSGSEGGEVALNVLRGEGGTFRSVRKSRPVPLALGLNTFKIVVPVRKGDVLGLDNYSSALIFTHLPGDPLGFAAIFQPALDPGRTDPPSGVVTDQRLLMSATLHSTPPVVKAFKQSARVWRELGTRGRTGIPVGTTFSFRLNQAANGSLLFTRGGRGFGRVAVRGKGGLNAIRFAGELASGRLLQPGRYSVRVTVENEAGDAATSKLLAFLIVG